MTVVVVTVVLKTDELKELDEAGVLEGVKDAGAEDN